MLFTARYDGENGLLSIAFPYRGGTYDFRRDGDPRAISIRAAATPHATHTGRRRLATTAGRPRRSGRASIASDREFVQMLVDMPIESVHTPEIHGVLVARHGKLVLEEYFHGEHRDRMHETRSAAKSLTATLVGAAMQAARPCTVDPGLRGP